MIVIILEKVPRRLRGELTRWLLEVDTGIFVGRVSATVRDLLWIRCLRNAGTGRCCLVYRTNNEQGFAVRMHGYADRAVRDFDGLQLVTVRTAEAVRKIDRIRRRKHLDKGLI